MQLPGVTPPNIQPKPSSMSGALRLATLSDLDGRTRAAQEARQMRSAILRDLTGSDDETALSALKMALLDNVVMATVIITDANVRWLKGEQVNLSEITTLANARRRDAQLLGLDRVMKDANDLDNWIAGRTS